MSSKTKLSKSILDMKFMKKTKEKVELQDAEAEGRKMYESEITSKMLHSNNNIIIEPSFAQIENLIDGRMSFRGMNPEIERLMELEQGTVQRRAEEAEQLRKMKTDVTDTDMLKFYSNLDNTMKDKFTKGKHQKRQRPAEQAASLFHAKKGKFMKPRDDD